MKASSLIRTLLPPVASTVLLSVSPTVFGADAAPPLKVIESRGYRLSFNDEFYGNKLDTAKWQHRRLGVSPAHKQIHS